MGEGSTDDDESNNNLLFRNQLLQLKKVQLEFMLHVADFYNPCKFRRFK